MASSPSTQRTTGRLSAAVLQHPLMCQRGTSKGKGVLFRATGTFIGAFATRLFFVAWMSPMGLYSRCG